MDSESHNELVDHLFREEHGKMVAVLTRIFGFHQLSMVEDVVQESFLSALRSWRTEIPSNPRAWLMRVARNRAVDCIRRGKLNLEVLQSMDPSAVVVSINELFHDREIADSQLRLVFACCHPVLNERDQIAFTLQLAGGFGVREIARALLTKEEAVKKRLQRARARIVSGNVEMAIPSGGAVEARLGAVLRVLYLIFNEGYHSVSSDTVIRRDLCAESMRLAKLVCEHKTTNTADSNALVALMCYHASRFDARIGPDEEIILLEDQDRSKWDRELLNIGNRYFARAASTGVSSRYLLEAAISAQHAFARSYRETRWDHLLTLYDSLYQLEPSPMIQLNRGIVQAEMGDVDEALTAIGLLSVDDFVGREALYHCVKARLLGKLGREDEKVTQLRLALASSNTAAEKKLIESLLP